VDTVADFYNGKTITIQVQANLDSNVGLYSQITGKALERYIAGKPRIRLESMVGADSEKSTAYAYT
jgi:hypothetical protein